MANGKECCDNRPRRVPGVTTRFSTTPPLFLTTKKESKSSPPPASVELCCCGIRTGFGAARFRGLFSVCSMRGISRISDLFYFVLFYLKDLLLPQTNRFFALLHHEWWWREEANSGTQKHLAGCTWGNAIFSLRVMVS